MLTLIHKLAWLSKMVNKQQVATLNGFVAAEFLMVWLHFLLPIPTMRPDNKVLTKSKE